MLLPLPARTIRGNDRRGRARDNNSCSQNDAPRGAAAGYAAAHPAYSTIVLLLISALLLACTSVMLLRYAGLGLLLLSWALIEARQTIDTLEQLTVAPVAATLQITAVNPAKNQLTAQIIRAGDRYVFPPLFVTLRNVSDEVAVCGTALADAAAATRGARPAQRGRI